MVEASPNSISTEITGKKFDLIACVSPVYEDFGIPKVKAVGMLTGLSEDKVVDDCLKSWRQMRKGQGAFSHSHP